MVGFSTRILFHLAKYPAMVMSCQCIPQGCSETTDGTVQLRPPVLIEMCHLDETPCLVDIETGMSAVFTSGVLIVPRGYEPVLLCK